MQLEREDGRTQEISTRGELERALVDLGARGQDFAILARPDGAIAQVMGSTAGGFVFEVVVADEHLQSRRDDLSAAEAIAGLDAWLAGGDGWRNAFELSPGPSDPASGAAGGWIPVNHRHAAVVLTVTLVLAGVAEWRRRAVADVVDHLRRVPGKVVARSQRSRALQFEQDGHLWVVWKRADGTKVGDAVTVAFDPRDPAGTAALDGALRYEGTVFLYLAAALFAAIWLRLLHDAFTTRAPGRRPTPRQREQHHPGLDGDVSDVEDPGPQRADTEVAPGFRDSSSRTVSPSYERRPPGRAELLRGLVAGEAARQEDDRRGAARRGIPALARSWRCVQSSAPVTPRRTAGTLKEPPP